MEKLDPRRQALEKACEKVGGQLPLAKKINTSQSQVWYWLTRSKNGVAAEYVLPIEEATGISRHALRPDLYPEQRAESAA